MATDDWNAVLLGLHRAGLCAIVVVLYACFCVAGCIGQPPGAVDTDSTVLVRDVTVHEAAFLIEKNLGNADFIILDVRTPEEYAQGFIAGSVNLNTRDPGFSDRLGPLDRNREYLLYCATGIRSAATMSLMEEMGFTKVYSMEGGISAWITAGYPVATP